MAAPRVLSSFLLSLFLTTVRSQLSIVNVTIIKSGEPFSVTCDADLASVPAKINLITSVTISRNTAILEQQTIAVYRSFGTIQEVPLGRNWTIRFTGAGRDMRDNRAMKITLVVHDSVCSDAGLYRCEVKYIGYNRQEMTDDKVENVTANAGYSNPVFTWDPNFSTAENPNHDEFILNQIVTLTCRIDGPSNGLKLNWRVGLLSLFSNIGDRTFYDYGTAKNITELPPTRVVGSICNQYRYQSTLRMTINKFDYNDVMYQCVVRDISTHEDREVGNLTITVNNGGEFTARSDASFLKGWTCQLFLGLLASALLIYE